ncbi:hypothetical protein [Halocola ammonii]
MNKEISRYFSFFPLLVLLLTFALAPVSAVAQNGDIFIIGSVKDDETGKKLGDVEITVLRDGNSFDQIETSGNGKYEFTLPLNHVYDIEFDKEGYISKIIRFDTKGIPEEDQFGGFRADLDMSMIEKPEGFDDSVTEEPLGIASFDEQKNSIEFDYAYTANRQKELDAELERVENLDAEMAAKQAEFDELIASGDENMADEKYEKAIKDFQDALGIFPDNETATTKLADAQAALEALENAEQLEENYQNLLSLGEENMSVGKLEEAKQNYQDASDLKPKEQLPKDKIAEIEELIAKQQKNEEYEAIIAEADEAFDSEDFELAIDKYAEALSVKPGESYPNNRKEEAERLKAEREEARELNEQYESLIASADELYDSEEFEDAIAKYQEAASLKPKENYPKNRIGEAEDAIAARDARLADKEAEAERQAKLEQFNQLIDEGESLLANEEFESARAKFQEAADLMPDKNLPKQKLTEVDEAIAAKVSEMAAEERAERQAELNAQYDDLIKQADDKFDEGNFESAREDYQAALEIKPNEKYPNSRLDRITEKIAEKQDAAEAERLAEQRAEEEAARKAEEEKRKREQMAQERLAEEQRLAKLEEEKREQERLAEERRRQEQEERDRERELLSNVDASKEDQVEKFFSEARKSDLEKKDREVERKKQEHRENTASYSEAAESNIQQERESIDEKKGRMEEIHRQGGEVLEENRSDNRDLKEMDRQNQEQYADISERSRSYNLGEAQRKADQYQALANNDERRQERIAQERERQETYREQERERSERGEEQRQSNEQVVEEYRQRQQNMETKGEDVRQENISEADEREQRYSQQQKSYAQLAEDRRQQKYEELQQKREESDRETKKGAERISNDNYDEIKRIKERDQNQKQTSQKESELRRSVNYNEQHQKEGAEAPDYEDYNLPEGAEDLAEGVTETSYDMMGGKMTVIERKVRIGNRVDVYKKVISKYSTYYFKNDRSITESTWRQNTLQ